MNLPLLFSYACLLVAWRASCRKRPDAKDLKAALAFMRIRTLSWGIAGLTILMPALRVCSALHKATNSSALPVILAAEAALCVSLIFVRFRLASRIEADWEARMCKAAIENASL